MVKTGKQEALELIERLPDGSSLETIIAELAFQARILRGLEQADRGETMSHEDAGERLDRWLTSDGPRTS